MARIRSIKPEFWVDEKIVDLSFEARLLFIGLWNFCDDFGRMEWRPKKIKMQIFPADSLDIPTINAELQELNLTSVYTVDDKEYLQINNFDKHQKIDKRAAGKCPCPDGSPPTPTTSEGNSLGREGIKEGIKEGNSKTTIPKNFSLTDQMIEYAKTKGVTDKNKLESFTENFIGSCKAKGYKYADFYQAWQNWFRSALDEGKFKGSKVEKNNW